MASDERDLAIELLSDPELKRKFISDPKGVLKDMGFQVEDDVEYKVVEDTKSIRYLTIPYIEESKASATEMLEKRRSKSFMPGPLGPKCPFAYG